MFPDNKADPAVRRDRTLFLLLNIGHFFDHFFTLIFATVAALALSREWGLGYGDLLRYATPGFFAFGLFALPAGWLADKWSRDGMMVVFFAGIGLSAVACGFAQTPLQMGIGLFVVGTFGAIYHPVGLAIVTARWKNTGMRIAVNGVWGNFGVASAALVTGYLIDNGGWRAAFIIPGLVSVALAGAYAWARAPELRAARTRRPAGPARAQPALAPDYKAMLLRVSAIVFFTAAISSIVFQSTTFALPKIFDERLRGVAGDFAQWWRSASVPGQADVATMVGFFAFLVFAVASFAQLVAGKLLDRYSARAIFMGAAAIQVVFFAAMPGLSDGLALTVAFGFMLGAFGQVPINDYLIGRMASGEFRARVYGVRYVVSFTVLALTLPFVSVVYERWGFDTLFRMLAFSALLIFAAVACLPGRIAAPAPAPA
jgi:MFS family permease